MILPLYVDLDQTLMRTDSLFESLFALFKRSPQRAFLLVFALLRGRAAFKQRLSDAVRLDPALLPYNERVLALVQQRREQGGKVILASAAHESIVSAVARHVGAFSDCLATRAGGPNLKGHNKLDAIREHAKGAPFAYCGDSMADLPILTAAQERFVVDRSAGLPRRLRSTQLSFEVVDHQRTGLRTVLKELRLHQWLKNVLLFLPAVAAHRWSDLSMFALLAGAFVCFGLVASATYVLNDLLDLDSDRKHPRKRMRPIASGALSIQHAVLIALGVFVAGLGLAAFVHPQLPLLLLGYVVLTVLYSTVFKTYAMLDVLMLAGLYSYRVLAGGIVAAVPVSSWLLAFSMAVFFSLALVKRCSEIRKLDASDKTWIAGRGYRKDDWSVLLALGAGSALSAVVLVAMYVDSTQARGMYAAPERIWLVCPLLVYWLSRLWLKTSRNEMTDDPLVYTVKDRGSLVTLACIAAVFLSAI